MLGPPRFLARAFLLPEDSMTDEIDLITTDEAARLIDTSSKSVRRLVPAGRFPAPHPISSRKIRHSRRAVLEWLEGTRQHRPSQSGN